MSRRPAEPPTRIRRTASFRGMFGLLSLLFGLAPFAGAVSGTLQAAAAAPSISISGNHFVDAGGNTLRLLGVNRSGSEYMCTGGGSLIFDGPSDDASIAAMATWNINAVRVPLNEDCWLGINGLPASMTATTYKQGIVDYVNLLHAHGMYAVLELHWNAPGSQQSLGQQVMVDADHGPAFWTSVATTFKTDHMVLFDLYNEPQGITWACLRDGCIAGFQTVGMQSLINTVRATGATQPVMVGGLGYAGDLSQWLSFRSTDSQLAASIHNYDFVGCTVSCWNADLLPILNAGIPVVTGELGERDCAHGYIDGYMSWADTNGVSYLGWAWNTYDCSTFPSLISAFDGTPTAFGIGLKNHLLSLVSTRPTVSSLSPSSGPPAGGTSVTIAGTNLTGATAVKFGAMAAASFTVNSSTNITATSPAGSGSVDVTVTTSDGTSTTSSADRFTYNGPPTISSVAPNHGPAGGGTPVTITGTNLTGATAVMFGAVATATYTVNSSTRITATSPAASGTVDVTVTAPGGTSATSSADQFSYVLPPTVASVAPASGPSGGGTAVTITGTNLTAATAVKFGATAATAYTVDSSAQINATSPAGSGTLDVTVTTGGGTSATGPGDQFTYVAIPTVTALSPSGGASAGGTSVTITGTNLGGATVVMFGATAAASYTVNSSTQITATSPAGAGAVDVTVATVGGASAPSPADRFTYNGPPTVGSVAPNKGVPAGGASVTITGTNFGGATAVKFGATPAITFTVNSPTQITAASPAGSGTVDVTVTAPSGTSATGPSDQFSYVPPPSVTATAFTATEGHAVNGGVATFTGGACPCTATISWGDGWTTAGVVSSGSVSGSHTYAEEGTETVSVTVRDAIGGSGASSIRVVGADAALAGNGVFAGADQGIAFTRTVATFTDADPGGTASDYTATIDWGDGTTSAGTIAGGNLGGTHTYSGSGPMTTIITITDSGGASVVLTGGITVVAAPAVTAIPVVAREGQSFSGNVASFTGGACACTALVDWGDGTSAAGIVTSSNVSGSHTYAEEGSKIVKVIVTDSVGNGGSGSAGVTIADATLTGAGVSAGADQGIAFTRIVATFIDADPAGTATDYTVSIDWGDGTTSAGTIAGGNAGGTHTYSASGLMTTTITVTDGGGASVVLTGGITVVPAPSVSAVAISATEGQSFSGKVASFTGGACTCTTVIDWGDGSATAGIVISGNVSGSHVYAEEGSKTVHVTVTDSVGNGGSGSAGSTIADAALTGTGVAAGADQGVAFSGPVATFNDADAGGTATDYSTTIAWGDGTSSAGTASGGSVNGAHTYGSSGTMTTTITITDAGGASAVVVGLITVGAAPSVTGVAISAIEGHSFTGSVAAFTGGACPCSALIEWGDGTTSAGTVAGGTVGGTHSYAEEGSPAIKVTVTDTPGAKGAGSASSSVADAALSSTPTAATAGLGVAFAGPVATFADADPGGVASDYTATIAWGDGTVSSGTITAGAVNGTHTYTSAGPMTVTVTIADTGGATTVAVGMITVAATPSVTGATIAANEGQTFSGIVASFTGGSCACTASVDWGDGSSAAGTVSGGTVSGSHIYVEEGPKTVKVTVTDSVRASGSATFIGTVADAAINAAGGTAGADQGIAFTGTVATFTDGDAGGAVGDYTATINWGDGTASSVGTVAAAGGAFLVTGSHTYSATGPMTATVTVVDAGGASAVASTMITVLAAPGITVAAITSVEGHAFSGAVAAFSGRGCPCAATISWGDGTTTAGTVSGGSVSGSHTYAEEGNPAIRVTVTDNAGASGFGTANAAVADAAITASSVNSGADQGIAFTATVASFTDADPAGAPAGYTATINWGDGTAIGGGTISGGDVNGSHTYTTSGVMTITVAILDSGGATVTVIGSVTVGLAPAVTATGFSAVEGQASGGNLATFTGGACPCSSTIDWGDGSTTAGSTSGGHATGSHIYAEEGSNVVKVTVHDSAGGSATSGLITISVADATLSGAGRSAGADQGVGFSAVVATFTDADSARSATDYTATIAWGDGATSSGAIATSGGGFAVGGSHTYAATGQSATTITIKDSGGASVTLAGSVSVMPGLAASGATFSGTEGQPFSGSVATVAGGACPCTATIDWGDGSTPTGGSISAGSASGTHTYAAAGSKTATVMVADALGVRSTTTATGNISDPALEVAFSTFAANVGISFNGQVAMVADPGGKESLTGYASTIDWGDGTTSAGTIVDTSSGFAVNGSHTYSAQGAVAVKVTVQEVDQAAGTSAGGTISVGATATVPTPGAKDAGLSGGQSASLSLPLGLPLPGLIVVMGLLLAMLVAAWRLRAARA